MSASLILIRHAEAEPEQPPTTDFDRGLTERGFAQVEMLVGAIRSAGISASRLLYSTARRTRQTAAPIAASLGLEGESVVADADLYLAEPDTLLDAIRSWQADLQDGLILVGHNPGLQALASLMSGDAELDMPTAGLLQVEWSGIPEIPRFADLPRQPTGHVARHLTPNPSFDL